MVIMLSLLSISKQQHQATRGEVCSNFFHLWINNRGGPAHRPGPTPTATRGQPQHPTLGVNKLTSDVHQLLPPQVQIQGGRVGKNHKTAKLAAACSQGRLPPQPPSRLQLARLPITGIGKHKDMASWHHGIACNT